MVSNKTVAVALNHKLSGYTVRALTKAHGILMVIAWPIAAGAAIYYPAYLKAVLSKKGEWFHVSQQFNSLKVACPHGRPILSISVLHCMP